jgi:hypothetical protein
MGQLPIAMADDCMADSFMQGKYIGWFVFLWIS